jgi:hypothetical protein
MPAQRSVLTLVPRPTKAALRPGHFTLDAGTALHIGAGAEPAADLLRTLLTPAPGCPCGRPRTDSSP